MKDAGTINPSADREITQADDDPAGPTSDDLLAVINAKAELHAVLQRAVDVLLALTFALRATRHGVQASQAGAAYWAVKKVMEWTSR